MGLLTFKGGIHPDDGKRFSKDSEIRTLLPKGELAYPLSQHIGAPANPIVKKGDHVLKGQKIAEAGGFVSSPIHASVSGTVKGIEYRFNPAGTKTECIIIENDGEYAEINDLTVKPFGEMTREEIIERIGEAGIVGMGGAGFPTRVKLSPKEPEKIEYIIANCAECEPLLKLHRQLLEKHAYEIMKTFHMIQETVGASEAIIGIKKSYVQTIHALNQHIEEFPGMRLHLLDEVYPMGDEVVLIYEATGRVVRPGGLPIEQGVAVFNVETLYNVYRAVEEHKPVTCKYVSVVAEVENPVTVKVPLGCTLEEVVAQAGGTTVKDPVYFVGGPMMGRIGNGSDPVTKTTNAILVLPKDHLIVAKKQRTSSIDLKRAASICCQCNTCTDLCPRHNLGHPIDPAKFMRAASNNDFRDLNPYIDASFCSSCGVCEMYSCPQSLAPRSLLADMKGGLRKAGIRPPQGVQPKPVQESREYRKVPEERLMARLGLTRYDKDAPLKEELVQVKKVRILLSQHIGAPAQAVVKAGDEVTRGQMIAQPAQGLSVGIHASVSGKVTEVTDRYIIIAVK